MELDGFVPDEQHFAIIGTADDEEWKLIAETESNTAADVYILQPLLKVILVWFASDSNMLPVKFHHSIANGSSGYVMTNDVLRFCPHVA